MQRLSLARPPEELLARPPEELPPEESKPVFIARDLTFMYDRGRTTVELRQLRHQLQNKAVFRPWNTPFNLKKIHFKKKDGAVQLSRQSDAAVSGRRQGPQTGRKIRLPGPIAPVRLNRWAVR